MAIDWSKQEASGLMRKFYEVANLGATIDERRKAVIGWASEVVSAFLARASGQVKEDDALLHDELISHDMPEERWDALRAALDRLATLAQEAESLRAKVAELETFSKTMHATVARAEDERNAAHDEVERLTADLEQAPDIAALLRRAEAAESRLAAVRECLMDMAAEDDTDAPMPADFKAGWHAARKHVAEVLEGDAPNTSIPSNGSDGTGPDQACQHENPTLTPNGCGQCAAEVPVLPPAQQHEELQQLTGSEPDEADLWCAACYRTQLHAWKTRWTEGARWRCTVCGLTSKAQRYHCSDTCTHDDADKPGHPERIASLSVAFAQPMPETCVLASDEPIPMRVRGRIEALHAAMLDAEWNDMTYNEWTCWNDGAEAMRAACWEAVQEYLDRGGLSASSPALVEHLKAAIEGATP